MNTAPFAEVSTAADLAPLEATVYVECSRCVRMEQVRGGLVEGLDPVEWARRHAGKHDGHQGFRTHRITHFGVSAPPA
ncbi:hypothetical protein ACFWNK_06115 [Streptomyces sp. NPDC058417]|uniref:DUF7848 domain-containing protein n=1 Tax=unclassified Streptomyces TaxID=2593676 RepID=UPI0036477414